MATVDIHRAALRTTFLTAFRPPAKGDPAVWAENNVHLPATAAVSGLIRLYPYQYDVLRSMCGPVETVTIMKAARLGISQMLTAAIGNFCVNDPTTILAVLPSERDCRLVIADQIEPTFNATPVLRNALAAGASQDGVRARETLYERRFPGGSLSLVSGGSAKNLRARTARVLVSDETDALPVDVDGEGDAVALAMRRTMSHDDRKHIFVSTPTDEETSRIYRLFLAGDQRRWKCPCPGCGEQREVVFSDLKWPKGKPEDAFWCCPECGTVVEEGAEKTAFIASGRWHVTHPERSATHHSFYLSAFTSTLRSARWGQLAVEFVAAKGDSHLLRQWTNTVEGLPFKDRYEATPDDLAMRVEPIGLDRIPSECIGISGGTDIQADRIEISTLGWTADGVAMVLEHQILWGNPLEQGVWTDLATVISRQFKNPIAGAALKYDSVMIDAADGNRSQAVYQFCRGRAASRVFPIHGVPGFQQPLAKLGNARDRATRLFMVGSDSGKRRVADMVRDERLRFSDSLDAGWFEQFGSERLYTTKRRGVDVKTWHRIHPRAEAWDCVRYAVAAWHVAAINVDRRSEELLSAAAPKKQVAVVKSTWLNR